MFKIDDLPALADAYVKDYPPNTGYTIAVAQAVYNAYKIGALPVDTNIAVQIGLQYDGKDAGGDLIKNSENRLPYLASYSLDKGADCADFIRNLYLMLFKRNIGDWTEGIYAKYKEKQVPWEQRRAGDVLLNKLSNRNPHATHAMLYIGDGLMLHTTSKSNPLRVDADTKYSAATRTGTGVFRVLTDEEYESLLVKAGTAPAPEPIKSVVAYTKLLRLQYTVKATVNMRSGPGTSHRVIRKVDKNERIAYIGISGNWMHVYYAGVTGWIKADFLSRCDYLKGDDVKAVQEALKAIGFDPGKIDGVYGQKTVAAVVAFQTARGLAVDGIVGPKTWAALFGA